MMLSLKQITDKCLADNGAAECRFLADDDNGKFYCVKKTFRKSQIDKEVTEFKNKQKSLGVDPNGLTIPIGDNCAGYTFFRHKLQGYDVAP